MTDASLGSGPFFGDGTARGAGRPHRYTEHERRTASRAQHSTDAPPSPVIAPPAVQSTWSATLAAGPPRAGVFGHRRVELALAGGRSFSTDTRGRCVRADGPSPAGRAASRRARAGKNGLGSRRPRAVGARDPPRAAGWPFRAIWMAGLALAAHAALLRGRRPVEAAASLVEICSPRAATLPHMQALNGIRAIKFMTMGADRGLPLVAMESQPLILLRASRCRSPIPRQRRHGLAPSVQGHTHRCAGREKAAADTRREVVVQGPLVHPARRRVFAATAAGNT